MCPFNIYWRLFVHDLRYFFLVTMYSDICTIYKNARSAFYFKQNVLFFAIYIQSSIVFSCSLTTWNAKNKTLFIHFFQLYCWNCKWLRCLNRNLIPYMQKIHILTSYGIEINNAKDCLFDDTSHEIQKRGKSFSLKKEFKRLKHYKQSNLRSQ